jgi:hypothetical protein
MGFAGMGLGTSVAEVARMGWEDQSHQLAHYLAGLVFFAWLVAIKKSQIRSKIENAD